ncbi:UNVERIFIED_CONTAM: hypothetical protein HDU68_009803 [Siphonaria sp. JEL0065]|nr:hypothetical protein HDU68_009803 [Siphonaria sp. JEL0065]
MSFNQINQNTDRCGKHVFSENDWAAAIKADKSPEYLDHNSIVSTLNDNWGLPSLGAEGSYSPAWPLKKAYQAQAPATRLYSAAVKAMVGAIA